MIGTELRQKAFIRASGYCERCGRLMSPEDFALHHRKLRSQGGEDVLTNVLAVHHECHNGRTGSIHLDTHRAYNNGWLVKSWADPAETLVRLPDRSLALLTPEGGYVWPCLECDAKYPTAQGARSCAIRCKHRDDDREHDLEEEYADG